MEKKIRDVILEAAKASGWTTYRLAKEAGLSPSHLGRWLNPNRGDHQTSITTQNLERIMRALDLQLTKKETKKGKNGHKK